MLGVSIKQRPIKRRRQKVIKKHNQNVGDKRIDWNWNSKDFLIPFSSRQILLLDWIIWLLNVLHRSRAVPQPIPKPFHENVLLINKVRNLQAHHNNRWPQHTNTRDNGLLLNMIVAALARPNWRQWNIPYFRVVLCLNFHLLKKKNSGNVRSDKWHLVEYLLVIMKSEQSCNKCS